MKHVSRLARGVLFGGIALVSAAGCLQGIGQDPTDDSAAAVGEGSCAVTYDDSNQWDSGFVAQVTVKNNSGAAYGHWTVSWTFPGDQKVQNGWNAQFTQNGAKVSASNVDWNGAVPAGQSVSFGFAGSGKSQKPTDFAVNGVSCNKSGGGGSGGGSSSSTSSTSSSSSSGSGGSGGSGPPPAAGYLHTDGAKIVDDHGSQVRITGINWFGLETPNYAPHGLWSVSMKAMLDKVKSLGYNTLRVPFSSQLFDAGSKPNGIDQNQNPDLIGLTGLQIMDKLVDEAGKRGLRIFLDRHRPDSGAQSPLWYTGQYSEQRWIDDWKMLAKHYAGNPTVIGADLHNEPHDTASWGTDDPATDWRLAAERAGNAILDVNPNWLIIVEGVEQTAGGKYWWGGNLASAGDKPVRLKVANRVVYSPHDYPATVFQQPWFSAPDYPNNLPAVWDAHWGYLAKQNIAPVLIGEFGTKYETASDKQWMAKLAEYIKANNLSFTFWCLNPDSGDTGGILKDDWMTVNDDKQAVISPLLAPQF